jgi:hypothetical protein
VQLEPEAAATRGQLEPRQGVDGRQVRHETADVAGHYRFPPHVTFPLSPSWPGIHPVMTARGGRIHRRSMSSVV